MILNMSDAQVESATGFDAARHADKAGLQASDALGGIKQKQKQHMQLPPRGPSSAHTLLGFCVYKLCAPPAVNLQPSSGRRPSTLPFSAALDCDISQQEVELALPKLSIGKAAGGAGWPAELLRYAAHYVTMEDGSRHKVWVLAPLLTRFLNHCFRAGALPPCVSSALVTPRVAPLMPPTTGP